MGLVMADQVAAQSEAILHGGGRVACGSSKWNSVSIRGQLSNTIATVEQLEEDVAELRECCELSDYAI